MERTSDDVQRLADAAQTFCAAWFRGAPIRFQVVVSDVGRGKTHVARKIAKWARMHAYEKWARNKVGESLPLVACFTSRILSPDDTIDLDWRMDFHDIAESGMVILDDIGSETDRFKTGIPAERLCRILNKCENRHVWITTNKTPGSWSKTWDRRVEDRLLSGSVITIEAPSYRSEV